MRWFSAVMVSFGMLAGCAASTVLGQSLEPSFGSNAASVANPLADTSVTPGKALLFELEAKFAKATA